MNPDAPTKLVGALGPGGVRRRRSPPSDGRQTEVVVELPGGRAEFQVRASPLIDRHHRDPGNRARRAGRDRGQRPEPAPRRRAHPAGPAGRDHRGASGGPGRAGQPGPPDRAAQPTPPGRTLRRRCSRRPRPPATPSPSPCSTSTSSSPSTTSTATSPGTRCWSPSRSGSSEQAPPGALVARWGGEEFFVALPGADAAAGLAFADDLRHRCEQEPIACRGRAIRCTVSGGVAALPGVGHHDGRPVPRRGRLDVRGQERRPERRAASPGPGTVHRGRSRGGVSSLAPP